MTKITAQMKLSTLFYFLIFTLCSTALQAKVSNISREKDFVAQLQQYRILHVENMDILEYYTAKKDKTAEETLLLDFSLCHTVINLQHSAQLIRNNPQFSKSLKPSELLSIEQNLKYYQQKAALQDGSDADCKHFN